MEGQYLATLSDKKLQATTDNQTAYYNPDVITAQDYSSFSVIQDSRQYGTVPRFTYNGKQLDRELNWQDYGMRESDAIAGRFMSSARSVTSLSGSLQLRFLPYCRYISSIKTKGFV